MIRRVAAFVLLFSYLYFFVTNLAYATPAVIVSSITNITHEQFQMLWYSSDSAKGKWGWDTVSHSSFSFSSENYAHHFVSGSNTQDMETYVAALLPATTYYVAACADDGQEACTTEQKVITLSTPTIHPALAIAPQVMIDTTVPSCSNGLLNCSGGVPIKHYVGSDCNDPTTGLNALWTSSNWGDTIVIPTSTVCNFQFSPTQRTPDTNNPPRYIVIQSSAASLLPGPGIRVSLSDAVNMPLMEQGGYGVFTSTAITNNEDANFCSPGGYTWSSISNTPGWYMYYCGVNNQNSISRVDFDHSIGAPTLGGEMFYNITLSTPLAVPLNLTYQGGNIFNSTAPRVNGTDLLISTTDSQHFQIASLNNYGDGNSGNQNYIGGTYQSFMFSTVTYISYSGSSPTVTCTAGQFAYSNLQPDGTALIQNTAGFGGYAGNTQLSTGRIWMCGSDTQWHRYIPVTGGSQAQQVANVAGALFYLPNADHLWVEGLNFQDIPMPPDPNIGNLSTYESMASGRNVSPMVITGIPGTHIVFDHCIFRTRMPSQTANVVQTQNDYFALLNSYLKEDAAVYVSTANLGSFVDNAASAMVLSSTGRGKMIFNNYLEGYGITMHFDDGSDGANNCTQDVLIKNNYFYRDLSNIIGNSSFNKNYFLPLRQLFEEKRGIRVSLDGNVFSGNGRNLAQGGAVALTSQPEFGTGPYCPSFTHFVSSATCPVIYNTSRIRVGDYLYNSFDNTQPWLHVSSVAVWQTTMTLTIDNSNLPNNDSGFLGDMTPDADGITDVSFTNNVFMNVPTIFTLTSQYVNFGLLPMSETRITVKNNLIFNWGLGASGGLAIPESQAWNGSGNAGYAWQVSGGVSDLVMDHNTLAYHYVLPDYASQQTHWRMINIENYFNENEGMLTKNNLWWNTNNIQPADPTGESGNQGDTDWNLLWGGASSYTYTNNVYARSGGNPGNYQGPNLWPDLASSTAPFVNSASNFSLLPNTYTASDTCFSVPGDCTTDGTDSGVNWVTLIAALGTNNPFFTPSLYPRSINGNARFNGGATFR